MSKKITIGLFIDTFYPMVDGVISVVDNYARRLVGYADVVVFAPDCGKYDDSKLPYKVVRCKSLKLPIVDYSMPIPKMDRKFIKELNNYKLDIVHIHSPFMLGKAGVSYAKKNRIPVIGTMHSQYKQDFKRAVRVNSIASLLTRTIIKVFNKCDECWAVNSEVARIFYEDYKYKTLPKVMNNASEMEPVEDVKEARKFINNKYNITDDEKVFLFVGRINKLKNVFFIVDSLKILKEKYKEKNKEKNIENNKDNNNKFKMLFVGNGQDEAELKRLVKSYKMENDIIFCGRITDRQLIAKYYSRADLFLFPSLYDASSIVQIEAASQKKPTLFLRNAATAATVAEDINGYISDNDIDSYANKIISIFDNVELYKRVCENCYKDLYKNWDIVVKDVYDKYVDIIGKNKD